MATNVGHRPTLQIPLLTELLNLMWCDSTKMPALTGFEKLNLCSSVSIYGAPHPQPLSNPIREGGVGLFPFEAERKILMSSCLGG
jgi:hypothetical protein